MEPSTTVLVTDSNATPRPTLFCELTGVVAPEAIGEGLGVAHGSSKRQIPARSRSLVGHHIEQSDILNGFCELLATREGFVHVTTISDTMIMKKAQYSCIHI